MTATRRRALLALGAGLGCLLCPLHLLVFLGGWLGFRATSWDPPTWVELAAFLLVAGIAEYWWHRRHKATCNHKH